MVASSEIIVSKSTGLYILYNSSISTFLNNEVDLVTDTALPIQDLFDPKFLKKQQLIDKNVRGRGETVFFTINNTPLVLRHYYRGGLAAYISRDRYLWRGVKQTRAYRELVMLTSLSANNLPAPKPFAARIVHNGCFYQADIITHAVTDTETLTQRLQHSTIDDTVWGIIGKTIAQFHQKGIYHADLNAHNILLNSNNSVFIIDFDKAKFKDANDSTWRQQNLQRLQRSIVKLRQNHAIHYFDENYWTKLEQSYYSAW